MKDFQESGLIRDIASFPSREACFLPQSIPGTQTRVLRVHKTHLEQLLVLQEEQFQDMGGTLINLKITPGNLFVIFSQNVSPEMIILTMHVAGGITVENPETLITCMFHDCNL